LRGPWAEGRRGVRLYLLVLVMSIMVNAIRPMMSYRALEVGADLRQVGLVAASYALVSMVIAVPVGRWIDLLGRRTFAVTGLLLMVAAAGVASLTRGLVLLALAQTLLGSGQICLALSIQSTIAGSGTERERELRFGNFSIMASLGQTMGPLVSAAAVMVGLGITGSFATALVIGCLGLLLLRAVPEDGPRTTVTPVTTGEPGEPPSRRVALQGGPGTGIRQSARGVLRVPSMSGALVASMAALTTVDIIIAYLPVYGEARGLSVGFVAVLLSLRAVGSLAARIAFAWLLERGSRERLLRASLLVPAVMLLLFVPRFPATIIVLQVIITGFFLGLSQPLTMSWVALRAPAELRATALGLRLTSNRIGQLVVPAILGVIGGVTGVAGVFVIMSGMLLAGTTAVRTPVPTSTASGTAAGPATASPAGPHAAADGDDPSDGPHGHEVDGADR
jgi:MFS family permease